MRLSLRTLLAFEDNVFDMEQHRQLERAIPAHEPASRALAHIREVVRDPRLGVPGVIDQHEELDPNLVAEYLDHQMSTEYLEQFENYCFSDDRYLAEAASVHQIVSNVLGEPARTNRDCRLRCYRLPQDREETPVFHVRYAESVSSESDLSFERRGLHFPAPEGAPSENEEPLPENSVKKESKESSGVSKGNRQQIVYWTIILLLLAVLSGVLLLGGRRAQKSRSSSEAPRHENTGQASLLNVPDSKPLTELPPKLESSPEPESAPKPAIEAKPKSRPKSKPHVEETPKPEPAPEIAAKTKPKPKSVVEMPPKSEPAPKIALETKPEPNPIPEVATEAEPKPRSEPIVEAAPETVSTFPTPEPSIPPSPAVEPKAIGGDPFLLAAPIASTLPKPAPQAKPEPVPVEENFWTSPASLSLPPVQPSPLPPTDWSASEPFSDPLTNPLRKVVPETSAPSPWNQRSRSIAFASVTEGDDGGHSPLIPPKKTPDLYRKHPENVFSPDREALNPEGLENAANRRNPPVAGIASSLPSPSPFPLPKSGGHFKEESKISFLGVSKSPEKAVETDFEKSVSASSSRLEFQAIESTGPTTVPAVSKVEASPHRQASLIIPMGGWTEQKPNPLINAAKTPPMPNARCCVRESPEPCVVFTAQSAESPWSMETKELSLRPNQYLLTAAPFRADLELGDFQVEMIGDSKLCILPPDENGIHGLFLDYGRLVVRLRDGGTETPERPLRIQTEKTEGLVSISGPRSLVFVDTFAEIIETSENIRESSTLGAPVRTDAILGLLPDPLESVSWHSRDRETPLTTKRETSVLLAEGRSDEGSIRNHPNWLRRLSLSPECREIESACRRAFENHPGNCEAALDELIRSASSTARSYGYRLWGDLGRFDIPLTRLSKLDEKDEALRKVLVAYFREVMKRDGETVQRLADAIDAARR